MASSQPVLRLGGGGWGGGDDSGLAVMSVDFLDARNTKSGFALAKTHCPLKELQNERVNVPQSIN